jgi:hypothetical protein
MLVGLLELTDLGRSRIQGAQLGWQGRRYTKILQDLGIKAHRPQGGHFGVKTTNIAASHPVEPLCKGISDLSNRFVDVKLLISMVLFDLQAPRRIWQSSEARLPQKVFNRTYDNSAQETEIKADWNRSVYV